MKKYLFSSLAIAVAIGFSAFTAPHSVAAKTKFTNYVYQYNGAQNKTAREVLSNYEYTGNTPSCLGGSDECSVTITLTTAPLVNTTLPTGSITTFNGTSGFPTGGPDFFSNQSKL